MPVAAASRMVWWRTEGWGGMEAARTVRWRERGGMAWPEAGVGLEVVRVRARRQLGLVLVDQAVLVAVSYTHLRAHETVLDLVCRLLLEKNKQRKE